MHSCRLPNGAPGEVVGWSSARSGANGPHAQDSCPQGGALTAGFNQVGNHHTPWVTWTFRAPSDVSVERFTYWRYARVHYADRTSYREASNYSAGAEGQAGSADRCFGFGTPCREKGRPTADPFDPANRVESVGAISPSFWMNCGRSGWSSGLPVVHLPPHGHLCRSNHDAGRLPPDDLWGRRHTPELPGSERHRFTRCPRPRTGGADYVRSRLRSTAARIIQQRFQASSSRRQEPYTRAQPCALEGGHTLGLDTRQLPRTAAHSLRVLVRDAAGNVTASRPQSIGINNGGASCPYGGGPRLKQGSVSAGRGVRSRSPLPVGPPWSADACSLDPVRAKDGKAVRACWRAPQRLFGVASSRETCDETRWSLPRPGAEGAVQAGAGCVLRAGGWALPEMRLRAKPSVALRASRRRVRNGQGVLFSGRLRSVCPTPTGGKLVELQAFFRGGGLTLSDAPYEAEWDFPLPLLVRRHPGQGALPLPGLPPA